MAATVSKITELDFDQIKADLKTHLKAQDRFKDYNFEGSNMAVMLDILAYNTYQNNFYNNMAISEMFLDSAQLRDSVVSHAKSLGYVPSSISSAKAVVNVRLNVGSSAPAFVVIPAKTKFNARCGNKTYTFYTHEAVTVTPINGVYTAYGVEIFEGSYLSEAYSVTGSSTQRFVISNANADVSSIKVTVKETVTDSAGTEYVVKPNLFGVAPTDKVYYLQPYFDDKYEITFGKDLFGAAPKNGNVVIIEYRTTLGTEANGINGFSSATQINGYSATVTTINTSTGGADKESTESIRFFAPKSVQVQDRAITESDYEILLRNRFSEIQAISVYGGEELNPPQYGRVVVAVDVRDANGVSNGNKQKYFDYLRDRCPIGIEPIIISPSFMYLNVVSNIYYNTARTSLSSTAVKNLVKTAILDYSEANISQFKTTFRYSNFVNAIDSAEENILSNDTEVLAIIPWSPRLNVSTGLNVTFANQLVIDHPLITGEIISTHKPAVKSSQFTFNGSIAFIQDDGLGALAIVRTIGNGLFRYIKRNIGTVNYSTGQIIIRNFEISSYIGSEIKLYGRTNIKDIKSPKNRILTIREEDLTLNVYGMRE